MNHFYQLVSCWHKLEHFSPASLPKGKKVKEIELTLPWDKPLTSPSTGKTLEFTIYLGVFNSTIVNDFVKSFFKDLSEDINTRTEKVCTASFKVDINGNYISNSFGVSTLTWALSQLEQGRIIEDNWSTSFNNFKTNLTIDLESELNDTISLSKIKKIQEIIIKAINWSVDISPKLFLKTDEKHISNKQKKEDENSNTDILNSFYIDDLEKIITNLKNKEIPVSFNKYLQGSLNQYGKRFDLNNNVSIIKSSLSPENYPDGSWPSKYSLSLMQQFAVNSIFNQMANSEKGDILSVNGPPGTGKTTLLRDLVAAIIVDRAKKLVKIKSPDSVFTRIGELNTEKGYKSSIYKLDEILCDTGIVIASSNNGAVENVSKELPLKKEVSPFEDQIGYFRIVSENCIDKDNWGLISAVLGNKENRKNLIENLWFNNEPNLKSQLKSSKISIDDWNKSVSKFNEKLNAVKVEKKRLEKFKNDCTEYVELKRKHKDVLTELENIKHKYIKISDTRSNIQIELIKLKKQKDDALYDLTLINRTKPKFFIYLFNRNLRSVYKNSYNKALKIFSSYQEAYETQNELLQNTEIEFKKRKSLLQNINEEYNSSLGVLANLEYKIEKARVELQKNYADDDFWLKIESKETQEACPWNSSQLKQFQSELFISAMELHEKFILYANSKSKIIETSISAFFDFLKGSYDSKPSHKEIKALWDVFFLVIPVISTTFASVQTMFKDLEKGDLPWLFIDEAGQAVPQAAAGAIWRSKRVVVVGDPLQIEPVVTIPKTITNNIQNYFGLSYENVNAELSVQVMADRINPLGMNLKCGDSDIWVGIPLRVHRRCINPMFKISNSIAYENKMVLSTIEPKEIDLNFESSFINVTGNVEGRHWVKEHGLKVAELLIKEVQNSRGFPDIFIISPFTEVSNELNQMLNKPLDKEVKKFLPNTTNDDIRDWLNTHIGTVHTFQGKQADGVILCLGLDSRTKGAANWASSKPNLLNVALTRAKYRFIAIGDENIWFKVKYFKELAFLKV